MKLIRGFALPDGEEHLVPFLANGPEFAGGPTYQLHKLMPAMAHVRTFRHAVDVGAHCGLWTRPLSRMFTRITAFEPAERQRECLVVNVKAFTIDNITIYPFALGEHAQRVALKTNPKSSGDTYVVADGGTLEADMLTLDSFDLCDIDFVKIDCEGYELYVLRGGERTIRRDRPVVLVEQKPGKGKMHGLPDTAACDLLQCWGAGLAFTISGDFCFRWR